MSPNSSYALPPLDKDGQIITDDLDKANTLNDFFRNQTLINDSNVAVPDVIQHNVLHELRSLILTPAEIEVILKSLPTRKAAGPNGISNRMLRELALELSYPLCLSLISLFKWELSSIPGSDYMLRLSPKQEIVHLYQTIDLSLFYAHLKKVSNEPFSNMFIITSETIIF